MGSAVNKVPAYAGAAGDRVQSLGWEDSLEAGMATHSRILAWRIPWTEEPGRLRPRGRKESDTTEQLHIHKNSEIDYLFSVYKQDNVNFTNHLRLARGSPICM